MFSLFQSNCLFHEEENGLELLGVRVRVSDFVKEKRKMR